MARNAPLLFPDPVEFEPQPFLSEQAPASDGEPLRTPAETRRRLARLINKREERVDRSRQLASQFEQLNRYLAIADKVTGALEQLSQQLFQQLLAIVQDKLTIALHEIL